MIKQIAWNTFKNTGNINTMIELIEVEKIITKEQENITEMSNYEYNKNKRHNTSTK